MEEVHRTAGLWTGSRPPQSTSGVNPAAQAADTPDTGLSLTPAVVPAFDWELQMLLLDIDALRPGMELARAVLHPDRNDLMLLSGGYVLDEQTITNLKANRIRHTWIAFPGLEEIDGKVSDDIARSHIELYQVLNDSINRLEKRVRVRVNVHKYKKAVHHMLADIVEHAGHDAITHQLRLCGPRLAGHQANCSYLALLVGAHLSGYLRSQRRALSADIAENTAQLGLGALLHDIGKAGMPDELRTVTSLDEQACWEEYRYHAVRGYEEVREYVSPIAAHVVLHHHQRYDGSGFPAVTKGMSSEPQPLSGTRIHVFSRVVAGVNVFDHLLCPSETGQPVPTIVAISQLRSPRFRGWFDPVVVEAIARLVPPFMIGQIIRLSDGEQAVVTENHPDSPTKPTVRILSGSIDSSKTRALPRPLDLRMTRSKQIVEVEGVDVLSHVMQYGSTGGSAAA